MDRLIREGNPPASQLASPVPQYKRPGSTDYEAVEGQHGAPFATLKDASGNVVSPATDAKLEQVKSELELVKSELEAIKANQLSGDQKVQLSGTIVEEIVLVNAIAIADTETYTFRLRTITGWDSVKALQYKRWVIGVVNSHNKPADCSISIGVGPNHPTKTNIFNKQRALPSFGYAYFGSKSPGEGAPSAPESGKSICYPIPILDGGGFTDLQFSISFQESPTSGALTIRVYAFA